MSFITNAAALKRPNLKLRMDNYIKITPEYFKRLDYKVMVVQAEKLATYVRRTRDDAAWLMLNGYRRTKVGILDLKLWSGKGRPPNRAYVRKYER